MDNNVPPYNTLLVADALIKANKEFDMLLIPNSAHGYAPANYVMRRRWDYFVKYLLDAEAPRDYVIPSAPAGGGRGGRGSGEGRPALSQSTRIRIRNSGSPDDCSCARRWCGLSGDESCARRANENRSPPAGRAAAGRR